LSSDEGMEAQKSEYVRRLSELKQVSGPAKMRRDESQNRSAAIASLKATYNKFRLQAMSSDQKYAHIEAAEKQKILTAATEGEEWLEPLVRQQVPGVSLLSLA
jgi:heat shock protein 4